MDATYREAVPRDSGWGGTPCLVRRAGALGGGRVVWASCLCALGVTLRSAIVYTAVDSIIRWVM